MNIKEFNDKIALTLVSEKSAYDILCFFNILKNTMKEKAIIKSHNKNKFIAFLKVLNKAIINIDFSNEDLSNMDLSEMVFDNCKFVNTNFENILMDAIEFESCCLDYASFSHAFMECACFRNSSCIGTNFGNTHLLAVYIENSDWSKSDVSNANLLEVEAHKWKIEGMIVNKNTAVNGGKFNNVDWSKTNVSNLNISLEQVKHFLQCTNGGKYLQVYENYSPSFIEQREDAILKALMNEYKSKKSVLEDCDTQKNSDLIFLSYASEHETLVKDFYELEKGKYHLWMDVDLVREEKLKEQIEKVIKNCKIAVVFMTKEYLIKAWTRYELWRLLEEEKKRDMNIIIVSLEENISSQVMSYLDNKNIIILDNLNKLSNMLE